jgi:hypothetical protein
MLQKKRHLYQAFKERPPPLPAPARSGLSLSRKARISGPMQPKGILTQKMSFKKSPCSAIRFKYHKPWDKVNPNFFFLRFFTRRRPRHSALLPSQNP